MAVVTPSQLESVPSERDVVSGYIVDRIVSAFVREDFKEADAMSRFHAVLMRMSDKEYVETA